MWSSWEKLNQISPWSVLPSADASLKEPVLCHWNGKLADFYPLWFKFTQITSVMTTLYKSVQVYFNLFGNTYNIYKNRQTFKIIARIKNALSVRSHVANDRSSNLRNSILLPLRRAAAAQYFIVSPTVTVEQV